MKTAKTDKNGIASIIAREMAITGEIGFKGKARIDGRVEGNIKGEYLILSDTGRINGDLEVGTLVCHGGIEGNVTAKTVTVHSSAEINGTMKAEDLTVESGAVLDGTIHAASRKLRRRDSVPDSTRGGAAASGTGAAAAAKPANKESGK